MQIHLTESFQRDVIHLSEDEQNQVFPVVLSIPTALKNPHVHGGLGVRKIHPLGLFEARVGLDLRIVFRLEPNGISLHRVGTHDDIRRYLKSL